MIGSEWASSFLAYRAVSLIGSSARGCDALVAKLSGLLENNAAFNL